MIRHLILGIFLFVVLYSSPSFAQEVESTAPEQLPAPQTDIHQAQSKADDDLGTALQEAAKKEQEILADRQQLLATIGEMEKEKKTLLETIGGYEKRYNENDVEIERMNKRLEEQQGEMDEITGSVRGIAQDLKVSLRQSLVSGFEPGREDVLAPLVSETVFPSLENIQKMADVMFDEINRNGQIVTTTLSFMDAGGRPTQGEVTRIGTFNAIFNADGNVGYLEYSPGKQSFHELAAGLPGNMKKEAAGFVGGSSSGLFLDLSGGGALRQLTDMPTWTEEMKAGGILMYPLLGLGILALLLILERFYILLRESKACQYLAREITPTLQKLEWSNAQNLIKQNSSTLARVLEAGIQHREEETEVLEAVMEEEIQGQLPRLERNMRFLQIIAMVSPLLGLLGTVTGMIATFQMITLYGTGDPKIMSGGISEALVTTMYGLIVAIPIMLLHGYLGGISDRVVGLLEEKSIMFVNVVNRSKNQDKTAA